MKFINPFDVSNDRHNIIVDGIRFHIRESEEIKEKVKKYLINIEITGKEKSLDILEYALDDLGYNLNQLTIADEHELLDIISKFIFH